MAYQAKVLCDSVSPDGVRLTSMEVTFPRIVLAEFNTHRTFSRNSASSRAIPVEKMLKRVEEDPFIPVYWGANQKGMQAEQELSVVEQKLALEQWMIARDNAVSVVKRMQSPDINLHKQIANRLLEPFLWHTAIVTATEWENFWGLRCNPMAQPEIKRAAEMMRDAYNNSAPSLVYYDDWHLPLVEPSERFDLQVAGMSIEDICKISVGRCARVSYLTHDGKRDPKADIELYDRLLGSGHLSPFEHVAQPITQEKANKIMRKAPQTNINFHPSEVFCGNFRGWNQLRKMIPFEDNFSNVIKSRG